MKSQAHGGTKAFLQTALSLQKFMRHLDCKSYCFNATKLSQSLSVDAKGKLQEKIKVK